MARYLRYHVANSLTEDFLEPWGQCDLSGQMFPRNQLVRQMIQSGNQVTWSGFWVYRDYIDPLDDQLRPPPVKADPFPVKNPRPNLAVDSAGKAIYPDASREGPFLYPPPLYPPLFPPPIPDE